MNQHRAHPQCLKGRVHVELLQCFRGVRFASRRDVSSSLEEKVAQVRKIVGPNRFGESLVAAMLLHLDESVENVIEALLEKEVPAKVVLEEITTREKAPAPEKKWRLTPEMKDLLQNLESYSPPGGG